jgi:alpha-L-arabinofuranosidase
MDKQELSKLNPEVLADAILNMGHIIRTLDEDNEYIEYWTHDGEYINSLPYVHHIA